MVANLFRRKSCPRRRAGREPGAGRRPGSPGWPLLDQCPDSRGLATATFAIPATGPRPSRSSVAKIAGIAVATAFFMWMSWWRMLTIRSPFAPGALVHALVHAPVLHSHFRFPSDPLPIRFRPGACLGRPNAPVLPKTIFVATEIVWVHAVGFSRDATMEESRRG